MHILMITLSFLVIINCASAQENQNNFMIENLGDGVYVHHGVHLDIDDGYKGDICNTSFVVGSKGVAVIDTGGSVKVGNQLRGAIKKITTLPILYVINTHVHPDHIYGNAAFLVDNPKYVGHEKLPNSMELRQEQYLKLNLRLLGSEAGGGEIIKPSILVKINQTQNLTLDLGGRKLILNAHPLAHTNTDVSIIDSKTGTLFTGDLLFTERTPVLEGSIEGMIEEVEKFKSYNIKQVVPGHGLVTKEWMTAISNEQNYLNLLLNDIRASIKKGESMESTMNTAAAKEKSKWLLFEVANRRNINTFYPILEWE